MATHIIIDGYNLIGIRKGLTGDLQVKRAKLIQELVAYRKIKRHAITLIFDGWQSGETDEHREVISGITVIFSRRGEKADKVIQRLASRERSRCIVVSSDREVQDEAVSEGAVAITSGEFDKKLRMASHTRKRTDTVEEAGEPAFTTKKKGNPRRPSKAEKKKRKKLEKL